MDKPFFSTQNLYPVSLVVVPCIAIGLLALCVIVNVAESASPLPLMLISIGSGILLSVPIVRFVGLRKSYIKFYDDRIEGVALPTKIFGGLNQMQSFELGYDEIVATGLKKDVVTIVYNGGRYDVQAYRCEQKIMKLIKLQKYLSEQSNSVSN